jgi:hypothetical protein
MRVKRRLKCEGLCEGAQAAHPVRPNDPFELVGFYSLFCNNSIKGWAGQAAKFILAAIAPSRSARRGKCRNRGCSGKNGRTESERRARMGAWRRPAAPSARPSAPRTPWGLPADPPPPRRAPGTGGAATDAVARTDGHRRQPSPSIRVSTPIFPWLRQSSPCRSP